jgi:hypothetical protein
MKHEVDKDQNPLLSDANMAEHVQLAIEGSTGRAVNTADTPCTEIHNLQERSGRAAARIVLGIDTAGLRLATGQGQKLEARVKEMLESAEETPATIAALLKRYTDRVRYLKRAQRRGKNTKEEQVGAPDGDVPVEEAA